MKSMWLLVFCFFFCPLSAEASARYSKGRLTQEKYMSEMSLNQHLARAKEYLAQSQWNLALSQYDMISLNATQRSLQLEALYGKAICNFHLGRYEEANKIIDAFLKESERNAEFLSLVEVKFKIAEKFRLGEKRRPFSWKFMPKMLSGRDLATKIYDEVVASGAQSDLAAQALFSKGLVLKDQRLYAKSNQAFQRVISDFNTHYFAIKAYEAIANNYFLEMQTNSRSEDYLELATLNLHKMKVDFPNADLTQVELALQSSRELYAQSLLSAAQLYQKKGHVKAANLYLHQVITAYPHTKAALQAQNLKPKTDPALKNG